MEQVERIGISLEKDLLALFDKMIEKQGYPNRSEAVRDLIRGQLSSEQLLKPSTKAFATVTFVYNHHATKLMEKLTTLQHSHLLQIICSTHVHLDHDYCMEIIVLKGPAGKISKTADYILSQKGIKLGKISLFPLKIH